MSEDGGFRLVSVCRAHVYQRGSRGFGLFSPPTFMFYVMCNNVFLRMFYERRYHAGGDIQKLTQITWLRWKQCNVRRMAVPSVPPLREWGRFEKLSGALSAALMQLVEGGKNRHFVENAEFWRTRQSDNLKVSLWIRLICCSASSAVVCELKCPPEQSSSTWGSCRPRVLA